MHVMSKRRAVELENERNSKAWFEEYAMARLEENEEWWARYREYLKTSKWADKRARVLRRDNYLCQACCRRDATAVHHLTYTRVCSEPLFDLISICEVCHAELHPRLKAGRRK
mgnify:CR=1 FL=1